jgi:hypothetical protein
VPRGGGPLEPASPQIPDVIICRRVVDYAPAPIPDGAEFTPCADCNALVAYNPKGPFQYVPKICMQCARIRPLPMD